MTKVDAMDVSKIAPEAGTDSARGRVPPSTVRSSLAQPRLGRQTVKQTSTYVREWFMPTP
jgi:hypothetical protein